MKEVFNFYLNKCHQAMIHENELLFEFNEYHYTFTFDLKNDFEEEIDDDFYSFNTIDNISKIESLLDRISGFVSFEIKGYEYLGLREDLTEGKSITNEMYLLIKKINFFKKNVILNYSTEIMFGDPMCPDEGNYMFIIEMAEELWWDIEFAKYIINCEIKEIDVPYFYNVFFRKNEQIRDNKELNIITTNTKTRRIGYLKALSLFFEENKKIPAKFFNKKFEFFSLKYKYDLEQNLYNKGLIIETKTGVSAKPYVDLAIDVGFINIINSLFHSGKYFKVYHVLQGEYSTCNNIFELSTFDKLFFLEHILKNDYFYFNSLLELLYIEEKLSYSELVKVFQNHLINRLDKFKKINNNRSRDVLNSINTVLIRIKNWEKAEVYLEHILMPRLNWMLDFGIIVGKNNEFEITKIGSKLFQHFCIWNDINTEDIVSPSAFLDRFVIHFFDDCFNENPIINPIERDFILNKLFKHLSDSFNLFKTLAPNRVTLSQAVNYSKYKLYFENEIKVSYQFIFNELSNKEQDKFIFKYQEQYQDGYIQTKNN